jgi:tetratricopeptide (TPR) repeat protein
MYNFDIITKVKAGKGILLSLLFIIPFVLYLHTINFDFVYHDDDVIILEGAPVLKEFNFKKIFLSDAWLMDKQIVLYRPWQSFTYAVDFKISGRNPWFYHLHNVFVFCLSIQLIFLFLCKLAIPQSISFWLTLLYSVHGLFAHTVSWVPARGDLYLTLFGVSSIIFWMQFIEKHKLIYGMGAAILFFGALLSKESAMALPLIYVLILYFSKIKKPKQLIVFYMIIVFVIEIIVYMNMRKYSVAEENNYFTLQGLVYNLPTIPEEIFKFFLPVTFSVMPSFNTFITTAGSAILLLFIAAFVYKKAFYDAKLFLLGVTVFLTPLLPSLFYKPVFAGHTYDYLDHRMFFPGIGLLIISYCLLPPFFKLSKMGFLPIILVPVLAYSTYRNSNFYKNYKAYYDNSTNTNPQSSLAWLNYGICLSRNGLQNEALVKIDKAVELYPDIPEFRIKRAEVLIIKKEFKEMVAECRRIISINSRYDKAYLYIAGYYNDVNLSDSVVSVLSQAIRVIPSNYELYYQRGLQFIKFQDSKNAISDMSNSILLNPKFSLAYSERGSVYGLIGQYNEALEDFNKFISLEPNNPVGYFNRSQAYYFLNMNEECCTDLAIADKLGLKDATIRREEFCKH